MKKGVLFLFGLLVTSLVYAQRPILRFNSQGEFKIVQFTDIHYQPENPESKVSIELIKEVIREEQPDLILFTGDVVWAKPAYTVLDHVFDPVVNAKIPFAYIFGNHDDEYGKSRDQLMEYAQQKPYCLSVKGDKQLAGVGNFVLEIKNSKDENAFLLYLLDSSDYSKVKNIGTYDWLKLNQIEWYTKESKAYTEENKGTPYPALAFFHIALEEFYTMCEVNKSKLIGNRKERECNGFLNTGMFAAMRQAGDVMGIFVGHDHDNDYVGIHYDVALGFGRYSGGNTVYNNLGKNGCRVFQLKEGKREFKSYIRLLGGKILYPIHFPYSFN